MLVTTIFTAAAYESIKYWIPICTAGTLVCKVYASAKRAAIEFGHTLITNHFHHLQKSLDELNASVISGNQVLSGIRLDGQQTIQAVTQVKVDLAEHNRADAAMQAQVLAAFNDLRSGNTRRGR